MQVIVMPAGSSSALVHYHNTIEIPVPLEKIRTFSGDQIANELQQKGGSAVAVWGFTAGVGNRNVVRWNKIEPGAVALFGGEGKVKSYGTVILKARLPELAAALWGRDGAGNTWSARSFVPGAELV